MKEKIHIHPYMVSVTNFDPNYLETGRTEWAEIFLGYLIFHLTKTKNHLKKVCTFGCQSWFFELRFFLKNN